MPSQLSFTLKKALIGSIGKNPDYKIMNEASKWLERNVFSFEDVDEIQSAIDEHNGVSIKSEEVSE